MSFPGFEKISLALPETYLEPKTLELCSETAERLKIFNYFCNKSYHRCLSVKVKKNIKMQFLSVFPNTKLLIPSNKILISAEIK